MSEINDSDTITLLTREGLITRPMTPSDKRERSRRERKRREEEVKRSTAKAWFVSLLAELGLTEEEYGKIPSSPGTTTLLADLDRWTGEEE